MRQCLGTLEGTASLVQTVAPARNQAYASTTAHSAAATDFLLERGLGDLTERDTKYAVTTYSATRADYLE